MDRIDTMHENLSAILIMEGSIANGGGGKRGKRRLRKRRLENHKRVYSMCRETLNLVPGLLVDLLAASAADDDDGGDVISDNIYSIEQLLTHYMEYLGDDDNVDKDDQVTMYRHAIWVCRADIRNFQESHDINIQCMGGCHCCDDDFIMTMSLNNIAKDILKKAKAADKPTMGILKSSSDPEKNLVDHDHDHGDAEIVYDFHSPRPYLYEYE